MDAKLFFSTFLLIFLAELGDKTQLAAMARAAGAAGAKWTVFFAASSALVVSTLVAVLFGHVLTRFVPTYVIKLAAGILFLLFGGLILYEALARPTSPAARTTEAPVAAPPGLLVRAVLRTAAAFEQAAADDYTALAAQVDNPATRELLLALAAEEREHLHTMRAAATEHLAVALPGALRDVLPEEPELMHDVAAGADPILAHAAEHEAATARFYLELARSTPIPSLKQTFEALARAEQDHAARLRRAATA